MHKIRAKYILLILVFLSVMIPGRAEYALSGEYVKCGPEEVKVYFKFGSAVIDSAYMENPSALRKIDSLIRVHMYDDAEKVEITGYASFDGPEHVNDRLSEKRGRAVKSFLLWKYPGLDADRIHVSPMGEFWEGLKQAVEADPSFPSSEEVLRVLDSGLSGDLLEARIKSIDGGRPYKYILANRIIRGQRFASIYPIRPADEQQDDSMRQTEATGEPTAGEEIMTPAIVGGEITAPVIDEEKIAAPVDAGEKIVTPLVDEEGNAAPVAVSERTVSPAYACVGKTPAPRKAAMSPRWAVKTNMLYDAALMPNIEGEYYFAPHFSASLSAQIAWWHQDSRDRYYQLWLVWPEVRYWPGRRGSGNGLYIGAYGTSGSYDIKWGTDGYRNNWLWSAGLTCGYILPLRGRFALEFGLGAGYMNTQYETYTRFHPMGNHYVYESTEQTSYFGITKATIGAVWRFGTGKNAKTR